MKLLAISDTYIPAPIMRQGLASLEPLGASIEVRSWEHAELVQLQQANLAIEKGGPAAVPLPEELSRGLEEFDCIVVQFTPLPRRFLERAAKLRVIGVLRTGTENVDVPYATGRGISVLNTPGRNARAVAECTVGLILSEIRNIARAHAYLVHGEWRRKFPNSHAVPELYEKTVGLVGYGAVGRLVAGYLQAFGSRILAYDPYAEGDSSPATMTDLESLLRQADVVSIHARLSDETFHLIGARELAWMKPNAILVNTARSGLVDEAALVEALAARQIQGAALDVFDVEPLPADHPLLKLDNVTLAPHLAGSTIDAFLNSPRMMAAHLARMLAGHSRLPVVNGVAPRLRTD